MCGYKDLLNLRGREIYPFLRESVQLWKVWDGSDSGSLIGQTNSWTQLSTMYIYFRTTKHMYIGCPYKLLACDNMLVNTDFFTLWCVCVCVFMCVYRPRGIQN